MLGAAGAGAQFLGDREPHSRRDLLGAQEIFMRGVFQRAAVERHQALVAVHVGALVDGHGEMALAEQRAAVRLARSDRRGDTVLVEAGAGAHLVGRGEIDHQHAHWAVALRLQNEAAVDLQRCAEHDGEHHRLAQELGHRIRIGMTFENLVDERPQPHHAAAQIEAAHLEGHDGVVGRGRRRRARGNFDVGAALPFGHDGFGHRRYVESKSRKSSPHDTVIPKRTAQARTRNPETNSVIGLDSGFTRGVYHRAALARTRWRVPRNDD